MFIYLLKLETDEQRRRTRVPIWTRRYIISIRAIVITNNNNKVPSVVTIKKLVFQYSRGKLGTASRVIQPE